MSTQPSKPANSPFTSFTSMYAMSRNELMDLLHELNTATFLDNIQLLFETPVDNLISLRCYPFDVKAHSPGGESYGTILINVVQMATQATFLGTASQPMISLGSLEISRYFGNFLDYAPYTKIELYLPYIGFVTLDTNEVMGKTISIQYAIDYMTGNGTAFVMANDVMIYTGEGQVGINIPIGGRNAAEIAKNNLVTGINAVGGAVITGGLGPIAASSGGVRMINTLTGTTVSAIEGNKSKVTKGSIGNSANGFYAPQNAYLIITRPNPAEPVSYAHQFGRPSLKTEQLQSLTGYTIVDRVHVEGIKNGTQNEINEIERLLMDGVIL